VADTDKGWSGGQKAAFGTSMGFSIFSALMNARAASAKAAADRIKFEEAELNRQMQNQIENRNIAMDNAAKWMNNQRIAESANLTRAENEFWIKYNFDNAAAAHGQQTNQAADMLLGTLHSRNINPNSGTAQALHRSMAKRAQEGMMDIRISASNQLLAEERKQDQALASRDFGFNDQIAFTPAKYGGPSPQAAFNMTLMQGLASTAASGATMAFGA